MSIQKHTVEALDGSSPNFTDRVIVGQQFAVANGAGGGAGASVTVAITFTDALPPNYSVFCQMTQDATYYITGKTSTGFNVVLSPRLAANTLASGNFDVLVLAA